jgi:biopolymer transport protein TolR
MRPPLVARAPMLKGVNITPIIDVALVLVIILLVTAPMFTIANVKLRLPSAHTRDLEEQGYLSVTIGEDARIAVEDRFVQRVEDVAPLLRARLGTMEREDVLVVIRADAGLSHSLVRQVMEQVREGGARRLAMATRQKWEGRR